MKVDSIFKGFLPLVVLLAGSAFGMAQIQKVRYRLDKRREVQEDELDEYIEVYKKELEENEVLQQNLAESRLLATKEWVNIRGPPEDIDDNIKYQEEQRKLELERQKQRDRLKEKS